MTFLVVFSLTVILGSVCSLFYFVFKNHTEESFPDESKPYYQEVPYVTLVTPPVHVYNNSTDETDDNVLPYAEAEALELLSDNDSHPPVDVYHENDFNSTEASEQSNDN
jgi:hypothetical protein